MKSVCGEIRRGLFGYPHQKYLLPNASVDLGFPYEIHRASVPLSVCNTTGLASVLVSQNEVPVLKREISDGLKLTGSYADCAGSGGGRARVAY